MFNQRGQSSFEAAIMAIMLVIFVVVFCAAIYLVYSSYWAEHILYESLICYQERGSKSTCTKEAEQKINSTLLFSKAYNFKMESGQRITRAKLILDFNPPVLKKVLEKKTFVFKKELRI